MADTIRFPKPVSTVLGPAEADQIITLNDAVDTLEEGGGAAEFPSIAAWKLAFSGLEAPYLDVVIEFLADDTVTIGTGDETGIVALFGAIDDGPGAGRFLLGVLGVVLAGAQPQIPIISGDVGYAQKVCDVAAYDRLIVGAYGGDIVINPVHVTIRARPIRRRSFGG